MLDKLKSMTPCTFLWISIVLSETFTLVINSIQSYLWWGVLSKDLLYIGAIDALFVPLAVAPAIILFVKKTEEIKATNERLSDIIEFLPDATFVISKDKKVIAWNRAIEEMTGVLKEDIIGKGDYAYSVPFWGRHMPTVIDFIGEKHPEAEAQYDHLDRHNDILYAEAFVPTLYKGRGAHIGVTASPLLNKEGKRYGAIESIRDITGRKRAEEEMQKLSTAVENSSDWVLITDRDGTITYVNKAVEEISGYKKEEIIGQNPKKFKSGRHDEKFYEKFWEGILSGKAVSMITTNRKKSGALFEIYQTITPLQDNKGNIAHFIATAKDMTQQRSFEERLNYLAYYDGLTSLPNRILFIDRVSQGIARVQFNKKHTAVLIIDIDRFKLINDTLGADIGDKVLIQVGKILSNLVRDGDTVARLGSDEFGVALVDVADADDVIPIVEKVMNTISRPLTINNEEIVLTISIGISTYPADGKNAPDLMKNADMALANAKEQGRKSYHFYTQTTDMKASEFILMEKHLYNALRHKEFMLYYQPYFDISTKKLMGMEALIRWQSRDFGLVPPVKFIHILEDTRMIIEVGEWILETASRQLKEWQDKGYAIVPLSVNLSLIQFRQKDLFETVNRIIKGCGLKPDLFTLEITESAFMQNIDFTKSVLKDFKDIGFSISIDDFGTGYSSLSYLKRFPVDNLKIDISFIKELAEDPGDVSIITAIIAMAHTLNMKTIAEGVETEAQWEILRRLRCDIAQGYYLSRPLPAGDVEKFLSGKGPVVNQ